MGVINLWNGTAWVEIQSLQGKSAYQSALEGGYVGDEASFNLAIATTNEVYIGSVEPTHLEEIWIDPSQGGTNVLQSSGTSTSDIMSQNAVTNLLLQKVNTGTTVNGHNLSANISITASEVGAYTSGQTDTIVNNNFLQRNMLTLSTSIVSTTGATVSPDFTNDVYKCTSNYVAGNAVSISTYSNIPSFDTCKTVLLTNLKGSDITVVLSTTQTVGSIVYTFLNMKDVTNATITVPNNKTIEISYLFTYQSATTCNVGVLYAIQN